MEDRYPYLRFVIGAAQLLAGAVAAIVFLGGTISACSRGGFAGFVAFLLWAGAAGVMWTAVMAWIESIQLFLDLEEHARKLATQSHKPADSSPPAAT